MKSARHFATKNHRKGCKLQCRDTSVADDILSLFLCTTEEERRKSVEASD